MILQDPRKISAADRGGPRLDHAPNRRTVFCATVTFIHPMVLHGAHTAKAYS
jgi:hypothetical protein